ncbi:hypothetical protein P9209_15885 [Prescottella defluvii]|nr:hypothetical protein P9209_15885 [Prescottella defluvii]
MQPDLIIGVTAGFDANTYARLSSIAPTIARPTGTSEYAVGRAEQTELIGTALGRRNTGSPSTERPTQRSRRLSPRTPHSRVRPASPSCHTTGNTPSTALARGVDSSSLHSASSFRRPSPSRTTA